MFPAAGRAAGILAASVARSRMWGPRMSRLVWPAARAPVAPSWTHSVWLKGLALAAGLLVVDAALAVAIVEPRLQRLILVGLAVVGLALVFRFPFVATCVVLLLIVTVLDSAIVRVPVGPLEVRLAEPVLGALLLVALVRPRRAWIGGLTGWALVVFFGALCLSTVIAVSAGEVTVPDAYLSARLFAPLLLYFVIVRLFPEPEQMRKLLLASVALAAFAGFVSLLAAPPGSPMIELLNPQGNSSIRDKEGLGMVNRVRLPGVLLAYSLFWYAALRAARAERTQRAWWLVALACMSAGILVSFNRNQWVGLVLGLACMLVLTRARARRSFTVAIVVVMAVGVAGVLGGTQLTPDSPVYPIVERGTSVLQPQEQIRGGSFQERLVESRHALAAYERRPLTGIGSGVPFGATRVQLDPGSGEVIRTDQRFLHNQYLFLLLVAGPVGFLAFMTFLLTPVIEVLRRRMSDEVLVALAVCVLITMFSAIVSIAFASQAGATVVALLVGAMVALCTAPRPGEAGP